MYYWKNNFVLARPTCNDKQFDCENGMCIDLAQRCDGYGDCSNGRDENNCTGKSRLELHTIKIILNYLLHSKIQYFCLL